MVKRDYDFIPSVPLPDWLSDNPTSALPKYPTLKEDQLLKETVYLSMFETTLELISEGQFIEQIVKSDPRGINCGQFIRWILRDPERKQRYYEAQEDAAEILMGKATMAALGLTEGVPNEVERDKLIVSTVKWQMGIYNRKRFGDIKQVDINANTNINVRGLLDSREQRLTQITTGVTLEGEIIDAE